MEENVCGRHLNKRIERLIYAHPEENIAHHHGVTVTRNSRGGSVKCVICDKIAPTWKLTYNKI